MGLLDTGIKVLKDIKDNICNKKMISLTHFIASFLAIITILTIFTTYFNPYVVTTEIYREYFPEDYFMGSSLNTPNYSLKTTEIVTIKPKSSLSLAKNNKIFYVPEESFDIKINPNNEYECVYDNNEKITCTFFKKRSEIENIEISFSYKQKKNPSIILLDYSSIIGTNTIEENLILENTENAKITSFRANWIVNNDNASWPGENIKNSPNYILVDGNRIIPIVNKSKLKEVDALIYSWDINFKENEIKNIKILTNTNVNYNMYSLEADLLREEPSFKFEFPFKENNFEWVCQLLVIKDFPYPNSTGYYNGSSMRLFCFPWNSTVYNIIKEEKIKDGTFLDI